MKEILFRTADGLSCIERVSYEVGPRIYRIVHRRLTAGSYSEGASLGESFMPGNLRREYEYIGRVKELYVYEEVVTK